MDRVPAWLCGGVLALAAACGGGDPGDAQYGGEFVITSRTPAQGDANVHVGSAFRATFSRPLDPSTVVDANVIVSSTGAVPLAKTLSLADEDRTIVVTLAGVPALPANISVVFTSGIRDPLANAFPQDTWTFTMPEWWEPFGTPPTGDLASVAFDRAGNPAVAWCASDGVRAVRWSEGAWVPMGQVLSHGGTRSCPPTLVSASRTARLDLFGVAWEELDSATSNNRRAYVATWEGTEWHDPSGGSVDAAAPLATATSSSPMRPRVGFDRTGLVFASAIVGNAVQAWRWPSGGTAWTDVGSLNNNPSFRPWGHTSASTAFGYVVVWTESPTTGTRDLFATAVGATGTLTRLAGGTKLNATGRDVLPDLVAGPSPDDVIAFVDRDPSANTYAVQVVEPTGTRLYQRCAGQIADDASRPVSGIAAEGTLLALVEQDQLRIKSCDLAGAQLVGTPASADVGALSFLGFAGVNAIPTVAYVDLGSRPPGAPPRVGDRHLRIKQPNR